MDRLGHNSIQFNHILKVKTAKNRDKESAKKIKEFNALNVELNPICHLLPLLEAHRILHVSRIRFNAKNENRAIYKVRKYGLLN